MATAVVVARLGELYLVGPDARVRAFSGSRGGGPDGEALPAGLERELRSLPADVALVADDTGRADAISAVLGRRIGLATVESLRSARRALPETPRTAERAAVLAHARATLERVLASPDEVLVSLAREEERFERAVGREQRASEAFLAPEQTTLREYAAAWAAVRSALERHHDRLRERLSEQARRVVPNLAALVGERVAARLVAGAGGVEALGRMRGARIQLLGSRRRPSPERGPRFGVLYRADRMEDVPPDRRGAYARSLAALAAIAARADATTRADLTARLVARRDRRVEQLRARRP